MKRFRHRPLVFLLGLGLALVLALAPRSVSRSFIYAGGGAGGGAPGAAVLATGLMLRTFVAKGGVTGHALEAPAPPGARTLVYFHNNRETAEARVDLAKALTSRGLGVLLVEYRGYGMSHGADAPSEHGLYDDAEAALDVLAARGIGPERIILCGASLGTGVAAEMARRGRGSRLVLLTPYTSIPDLVTHVVPHRVARFFIPDHFDTLAKSGAIRVPTLVIHGDADEIVPFSMGERVANAIHGARLIRVLGGHHGDLFARQGERLLTEIAALGGSGAGGLSSRDVTLE